MTLEEHLELSANLKKLMDKYKLSRAIFICTLEKDGTVKSTCIGASPKEVAANLARIARDYEEIGTMEEGETKVRAH